MIELLSPMLAVSCTEPAEPTVLAKAQKLAAQLNLSVESSDDSYSSGTGSSKRDRLLLRVSSNGLELVKPDDPKLSGAVRVDFTAGHAAYRRKQQKKELLVRAVGGKSSVSLNIIDATGGLGRDSFLLAAAGHRVHIFERQPVIAALLADGLARAAAHLETAEICQRIRLTVGDAVPALEVIQRIGLGEKGEGCEGCEEGEGVDVVYLDPMFPGRRKSALVKKELQLLQLLARPDTIPERLLAAALEVARQRVVVKRPLKAPFLTDRSPSHSLSGKTVRFDVYLGCLLSRNREYSG